MSRKVYIAEVEPFSNDLEEVSSNVRLSLDKVQERINAVNNMDSFSGKAAKEAKSYFNELHLTILESFRSLFDDLNENLNQHMKSFGTEVDASESAIIESNYLKDIKEDINDVFESLQEQQESFNETIGDVSDITSATKPDFSDVQEWKKKSVKKIQEVGEDLEAFTSKGNEVDVGEIMHQIEAVMSKATTSKGKARFEEFKGASSNSEMAKLMEYNEEKKSKEFENANAVKDSVLRDADESSKTIGNKAYTDFKNGKITESKYNEIMFTLEKVQKEPSEDELNEEVSETFLEYLNDNKVEFGADTAIDAITDYAKTHGSLKLGGMINTFRGIKGEGFVMVNPKSSQYAQPFLNPKTHKWAVKAGKWGGRVATPVGFVAGWYDDVQNNGKTHGQAIAHSGTSTLAGIGAAAGFLALFGNPGGLAIIGAATVGTIAAMGVDYLYKNNKTVEKSVDWVGDRISDIGQGIKSFFSSSNVSNSEIHSPGFNAP